MKYLRFTMWYAGVLLESFLGTRHHFGPLTLSHRWHQWNSWSLSRKRYGMK